MNKKLTKHVLAAVTLAALVVNAEAAGITGSADTFPDTCRRNCRPAQRALNLAAKIKAAENDALRLAQKIAALQRPTITVYSNVKAPEPQPAPAVTATTTTAPNVINISGSTVVINQ